AISAQFQDSSSPPNVSPFANLSSNPPLAWVKPTPVLSFVLNAQVTNTTVSQAFTFPPNTPGTLYQLEASPASDNFATTVLTGSPVAQPVGATNGAVTVSVPGNGYTYALRLRVISSGFPSPSVWDALTPLNNTTTNINPGTIVARTATSLTGSWSFSPAATVSNLLAGATTAAGAQVGTSQNLSPPFSNPVQVTVSQLPAANTSYTLVLEHIDNGTGSPQNYLGSSVSGLTLAVAPAMPVLTNGGNITAGLNVAVLIQPDINSPDSLYALQIMGPSGSGYLAGTANGTSASALSASPVFLTSAAWAA